MQIIKYPITVKINKSGEMIYFSQLDMVRILERALRRSGLPFYTTKGFTPRVKISFSGGLKLGVEGDIEVTFYFDELITVDRLLDRLSSQLPIGLKLIPV
ncbi:MAG: TIGR03936 family radical SAM-associated protein [Candidatus Omnitrophica bacterium]|nr:TIGR03936 family radical SAM-associated protein [Candidatus Omnitrophota bacterium]